MWVIDISHVFREKDVLFRDNKNNDKDYKYKNDKFKIWTTAFIWWSEE